MNKTLGLILASVFLISTLGIIPGLVLTTEAITTNPAAPIFTSPSIITLSNTSKTYINLFLNPFYPPNSLSQKAVEDYDFGLAINFTVNAISLTISIPSGPDNGTYPLSLSSLNTTILKYAYYEQANESVFIVLYTGNSITNTNN